MQMQTLIQMHPPPHPTWNHLPTLKYQGGSNFDPFVHCPGVTSELHPTWEIVRGILIKTSKKEEETASKTSGLPLLKIEL